MNGDISTNWAVIVIVIIPVAIIAAAELDERLRQRESEFRPAAVMIQSWTLPFFALWALLVPVLGVGSDDLAVRVSTTGLLLSIAVALLRTVRVIVDRTREHMNSRGRGNAPELLLMLPRLLVIITSGWLLVQAVWGVDLTAALTALGVTSLVISFALQDTLSGLASGLLLLGDRPIQPGDWVRVGDTEGLVIDINWRTTRIRDRNGDVTIVPNSELAGSSIKNYTNDQPQHRVVVPVQVAFVSAPTRARAMLLDAARGTAGVLAEPPPYVAVTQIDDPMMGYEVHMWIDDYAIEPRVKSDFSALVWYQSYRHDVPLPSPAYDLFHHDPVAEAAEISTSQSDLLSALTQSPLLGSIGDDDLDLLAGSARLAHYAVGEVITSSADDNRRLVVISEGNAELVLEHGDNDETILAPLVAGDIASVISPEADTPPGLVARAVTDCHLVVVEGEVVELVTSRNAEFATASSRMLATRRRRAERVLAGRVILAATDPPEEDVVGPTSDETDTA